MPYWRLFYHLTWSTKDRLPLIQASWMPNLHNVVAAKGHQFGAFVYAVGGIEDHVHMVASVPPDISLAHFTGQVEGNSSHWANHALAAASHLAWQDEYGVVSFGGKQLDFVVQYVNNQAQHHKAGTIIAFMERMEPDGDWMMRAQGHDTPVRN